MEGITNEIRNKIKCAVKAKLQEIGAYVDEELPDYIMVMIANRRSKNQMTSELSLFLGSHTDKFTDWLHTVLERLEAYVSSNSSDKAKEISSIGIQQGSDMPVVSVKPQSSSTAGYQSSLMETDNHTEGQLASNQTLPNVNSKDQYVPMPVSAKPLPTTNVPQSVEDMEEDCLNIREEFEQDFHAEGKGLKKKSVSTYQVSQIDNKRRQNRYPEDRSPKKLRRDEIRPRRTERRITSHIGSVVRPVLSQVVKPGDRHSDRSEIDKPEHEDKNNHRNGVNSIVRVTARRKLPARMQAPNSLILKAVAEAQKSVIAHPPKNPEPEPKSPPALFTRKYREKNFDAHKMAVTITNSTIDRVPNLSYMKNEQHRVDEGHSCSETKTTQSIDTEVPEGIPIESMESYAETPMFDQPVETRFIVTLDGVTSLMSGCFEEGMDEDDEIDKTEVQDTDRKPVKSRLFRRRSTGTVAEVQQTLERCKFWPSCRLGERCSFHHPKTPCKNFPTCMFGDSCLFVHPPCKFDGTCTRKSCPYTHSQRTKPVVPVAPQIPISSVKLRQPSPVVNGKMVCKFFPACNNVSCQFFHPPACKYGSNCTRVGCTFSHPNIIPPASKMKWVTTTK